MSQPNVHSRTALSKQIQSVGWREYKLGELCTISKGKGLPKSAVTLDGQVPCIHYGELFTKYGREVTDVLSRTNSNENAVCSISGDVLMPSSDVTPNGLAVASCLQEDGVVLGGDILIIRPRKEKLYGLFLAHYMFNFKSEVLKMVSGSTVYHLYGSDLKQFTIQIPPLEEQKAIAQVLSDFDNLIVGLERLIAKKRSIKEGVMQELLRPKAGWFIRKLSDLARITMGQSPNSKFYNTNGHGLPLIQGNADIKKRRAIIRIYTSSITKVAKPGDILMSVRAPVGEVSKTSFECCIGRGVCSLSGSNDFLFYYLQFIEPGWAKLSSGTTFESVNSSQIKDLDIHVPPLVEQNQIAQAIRDLDDELSSMEGKLLKYNQIKQGVMNELLTGKTRLV